MSTLRDVCEYVVAFGSSVRPENRNGQHAQTWIEGVRCASHYYHLCLWHSASLIHSTGQTCVRRDQEPAYNGNSHRSQPMLTSIPAINNITSTGKIDANLLCDCSCFASRNKCMNRTTSCQSYSSHYVHFPGVHSFQDITHIRNNFSQRNAALSIERPATRPNYARAVYAIKQSDRCRKCNSMFAD